MSFLRIACLVCFFIVALTEAGKVPKSKTGLSSPKSTHTQACLSAGGLCIEASECPEGKLAAKRGLCTENGASLECCHDVGRNVRDCHQRGGDCVPVADCGKAPREPLGICPQDEVCCVFVN